MAVQSDTPGGFAPAVVATQNIGSGTTGSADVRVTFQASDEPLIPGIFFTE